MDRLFNLFKFMSHLCTKLWLFVSHPFLTHRSIVLLNIVIRISPGAKIQEIVPRPVVI